MMHKSRSGVLAVLLPALLATCKDTPIGPAAPVGQAAPAALGGLVPLIGQLVRCTPMPADSVTQPIGPAGGTILVGVNSLTIPAGALDSTVAITAVAASDTIDAVRFQPAGLVFARSASLRMSYANCGLGGLVLPGRIAYVSDDLNILAFLASVVDPLQRTVTGQVDHFSEYAIAW